MITSMGRKLAEDLDNLKPDFWSKADVGRWLKMSGFDHLISTFDDHDISGNSEQIYDTPVSVIYIYITRGPASRENKFHVISFCH